MEQFIEVHTEEGKQLINLRWVEEIHKNPDGYATIYFASNCPDIETYESYSEISSKIWR